MERSQEEFLAAYDAHADAIYRHIFFRVYSKARAEELVQETFLKTWQYLADGKRVENLRAFLYRVANNLVIDESRKKKEASLDALLEESDAFEPREDGRAAVEHSLMFRTVLTAMNDLAEDDRAILTMRYIDDLDPKDIAAALDITPNNASVRLHRATQELKRIIHTD